MIKKLRNFLNKLPKLFKPPLPEQNSRVHPCLQLSFFSAYPVLHLTARPCALLLNMLGVSVASIRVKVFRILYSEYFFEYSVFCTEYFEIFEYSVFSIEHLYWILYIFTVLNLLFNCLEAFSLISSISYWLWNSS